MWHPPVCRNGRKMWFGMPKRELLNWGTLMANYDLGMFVESCGGSYATLDSATVWNLS